MLNADPRQMPGIRGCDLDRVFEELTAGPRVRRPGKAYAAWTLLFQDSVRDLDLGSVTW